MKTVLQKSFALAALSFLCAQPVFAMTLAEAETACKKANGQLIVTRVATGARYVCKVGEKVVLSGMATPQAAPTPSQAAPTPVVPRAGLIGDKRPELLWDKKAPTPVTPAQPTTKSLAPKVTTVPAQVRVDSANAALAQEMKNAGRDAPAVAAALKARGASAPEIAQILKSVYGITDPAVTGRILKAAGFTAPEVAMAFKKVFNLDAQAAFNYLKFLGYSLAQIGNVMKDVYQVGAKAYAFMAKIAGFNPKQVLEALRSAYGLGDEAIRTILGAIGIARREIADAFNSITVPIGDAIGDTADAIAGLFSDDDPVWPGNIPTGTRAWYDTPASIRVTWNDNATGEDRYYVNVNRDNRGWVSYVLPPNRTSFVLSGADPKSNYCIDIKAFKHGKGWTVPSRPIVCVKESRPNSWAAQPPAIWFAQSIGGNKLKIGWRDNTRDEAGFVLYILSATGIETTGSERLTFPANTTEHTLIGAVDKQRYCFFVQAYGRDRRHTLPSNTMCVTHSSEDPRNRANTPGDNVPPSGNRN